MKRQTRFRMLAGAISALLLTGLWSARASAEDTDPATDPAVTEPAPTEPAPTEPATTEQKKPIGLYFTFVGGAGKVSEEDLGSSGSPMLGGVFKAGLKYGLSLGASYRAMLYEQEYLSANPAPDGTGNQNVTVDEKMQDAQIVLTFNTLFKKSKIVALNLQLAPRYINFYNPSFASWAGGLLLGADILYRPSSAFHLFGGGAWSMRFFGSDNTRSVMGNPWQFWNASAGFGFDLPADNGKTAWAVDLGWRGDWVVFEHNNRNYQTAFVGLTLKI